MIELIIFLFTILILSVSTMFWSNLVLKEEVDRLKAEKAKDDAEIKNWHDTWLAAGCPRDKNLSRSESTTKKIHALISAVPPQQKPFY